MSADSFTFSNTLSKGSVYESDSILQAYRDDAASRLTDEVPEAISNEQIQKGDPILETYRVEDDAIHGGMGSVWRVHHLNWDTDLAMKRPQPRFFAEGSDRRKEEFISECEHWIDLGLHPNIVSCYYVREIGGVPTIFSEWMDGGSLKDVIQSGRLYEGTEKEVRARLLDIALQAARGLQYAQEKGLIHQDVKPGNILLSQKWDAKVADFGLAKAQSQLTDGQKAVSSGYTLAYCPQAQAEGATPEKWMDVYAWALTVAEMYLGQRPWGTGAQAPSILQSALPQARVKLPEGLGDLLTRCLKEHMDGFAALETALVEIYRNDVGADHPRPKYTVAGDAADNLNNYAMSMVDLGRPQAAEAAWDEAIRRFPGHAASVLNRAFFLWHEARIEDKDVLDAFKALPDSPEKAAARETFALESGEKSSLEDGTPSSDIPLEEVRDHVYDASFETNERLWVALRDNLDRFDADTGQRLNSITRQQAGQYLELAAATADGAALYTGEADKLLRVDMAAACALTPVTLVPSRQERADRYPDVTVKGKKYTFIPDKVQWKSLWLEEGDSMLAVVEESRWRNPDDWEKFGFWCNYPHRRTSPKPPHVDEKVRYHVLRYRLEGPDRAVLSSITPVVYKVDESLEGDRALKCKLANSKAEACTRPQDRWRSVVSRDYLGRPMTRLKDAVSGRYVRSCEIIVFSPDNKRYLAKEEGLKICRTPERGAGNRLYALCRVKDVATLQREEEAARSVRTAFEQAMARRAYDDAIARFEAYRALPDKQDAAETVAMERRLDGVCRRERLHHLAPPAADTSLFDMTPFTQHWIFIYGDSYRVSDRGTASLKYSPCAAPVAKAQELVKGKLPLTYRNDAGEKKTLEGDMVFTRLLSDDLKIAYVSVEKRGPGAKLGAVEVDLTTGKMKVAALNVGAPLPSPDGTRMVARRYDDLVVFEGSLTGTLLHIDTGGRGSIVQLTIFPDGRFALYHAANPYRYGVVGLHPERKEADGDHAQSVVLPPEPENPAGMDYHGVCLTRDGCHLLRQFTEKHVVYENGLNVVKGKKPVDIPWLRLSWTYDPPTPGQARKGEGNKVPAPQGQDAAAPKKGLFARLFGKKG